MTPPDPGERRDAPVFTRESVVAGLPARRASTLLFAIENRSALVAARARRAMARFETEHSIAERERLFLGALAEGRTPPLKPTIQDIDRHAPAWRDLVPPDPALRAALLARIGAKYGLPPQAGGIAAALGADDPGVRAEYQRQTGAPIEALRATPLPSREWIRWLRDRIARRIESLPPFWLAYALTLTETVGVGVLALPIALVGFGPLGAILVLGAFGLLNTLTLAALVEAITRTGNMRYGRAFFGRLIGDYLGRPGNLTALPVLFGLEAASFVVCLVGLSTTIGAMTSLPVVGIAAAVFAANVVILWRDSLNVTVAVAVALGFVNLALILGMSVIAFADAGGVIQGGPGSAGGGVGILELIFGVALGAYFGHTSAGYSAKIVLAHEPSGDQFMAGNLAAMLSAIAIYIVFVLAVTSAVSADALRGFEGTALTPLARQVGPVIDVMGTVYVLLTMGLGSMFAARSLYNLTGELLHAAGRVGQRLEASRIAAFVVRAAPVTAIFVFVAVLLAANAISLTAVLALIGTLTVPVLGGVFPMLVLVAARRRGERVPGHFLAPLENPLIAALIALPFFLGVAAFGLWIWTDPVQRLAALAVCAAIIALVGVSIRRGAFRPRTVVEYRIEVGPPASGVLSVVSAGRQVADTVHVQEGGGARDVAGPIAVIAEPGRVRRLGVDIPASLAQEVTLWLHTVTSDGSSTRTAAPIDVAVGDDQPVRVEGPVDRLEIPSHGEPLTLTLSMQPNA
jgi:hypothetical protein